MIGVLLVRSKFSYSPYSDAVYAPIFITSYLLVLDHIKWRSKYVMPYIGRNSLLYWLLSGMFFLNTSELQFVAYLPKYALAILVWTMLLLTPFVELCRFLSSKIGQLIISK